MTKITKENYYDKELSKEFMSFSLFKNFDTNPARALADLNGEYPWFDNDTALLVGNYVHSYFESDEAHQKFISEHPEMFSTRGTSKGQLKSEFQQAQKMIERFEKEPMFVNSLSMATKRETIITGTIDGIKWKGKTDALDVDNAVFYDFKTVKSLVDDGSVWDNERHERVPFIISRRYDEQMAVYAELLKQTYGYEFTPVIWAVSKDKEPLVKPYMLTPKTLDMALNRVISKQQDVVDWRDSVEQAPLINDGSNYYNYAHRVESYDDYGLI